MKYINTKTGQYPVPTKIVERYAKRADRPNFVDPQIGKLEPVNETPAPVVDYKHTVKEGKPEIKDNVWVQTWVVEKLPESEAAEILEKATTSAREKRNSLLSASDWTQLLDSPVDKSAWATYRTDLRDVPQQAGFPFNISWPVKP